MKIDPGMTPITLPNAVENRPVQAGVNKRTDAQQTDVSLSPRALQLKKMESQLAAIPVVDRARVDSIKQAISKGQYSIDTGNIAEGLLASVKEMLHVAK